MRLLLITLVSFLFIHNLVTAEVVIDSPTHITIDSTTIVQKQEGTRTKGTSSVSPRKDNSANPTILVPPDFQPDSQPVLESRAVQSGDTANVRIGEVDNKSQPVSWIDWILRIITALLLVATFLISYLTWKNKTRPVLIFKLKGETSEFWPNLENVSNTDAVCLVFFRLTWKSKTYSYVDDEAPYRGIYNGECVWNVPAKTPISGHTRFSNAMYKITGTKNYPDLEGLELEVFLFYTAWRSGESKLLRMWERLPHIGRRATIYSTPLYKWHMYKDGTWGVLACTPENQFAAKSRSRETQIFECK